MQPPGKSNQAPHLFFLLIRLGAITLGVIKLEKFELYPLHISIPCSCVVGPENRMLRRRKFRECYQRELTCTGHRGIRTRNFRLFCRLVRNGDQFLLLYQPKLRKAMKRRHHGHFTNMKGPSHRCPSQRKDSCGRSVSRNLNKHTYEDRVKHLNLSCTIHNPIQDFLNLPDLCHFLTNARTLMSVVINQLRNPPNLSCFATILSTLMSVVISFLRNPPNLCYFATILSTPMSVVIRQLSFRRNPFDLSRRP